mgnify:CR=1 FL=1
MIVLNFDADINAYANRFTKILGSTLSKLINGLILCPVCSGCLKYNCTYRRNPRALDGRKFNIEIIQVCCGTCKKTHALIPDFLMPYKQYTTETIETAISSDITMINCFADNSTIYRWNRQFKARGIMAVLRIRLIVWELHLRYINANELSSLSIIQQLSFCLGELKKEKSGTVIGATNVVLTGVDAGFL